MQIVAGGVPSGEDFYEGRQNSITELRNKIIKNDVLLIGPRRTGKTSVIKEYLRQEKESNKVFYSIFIDLEKAQNLYEFYFIILKSLYQTCKRWKLLTNNGVDFLQRASNLFSEIFEGGIDPATMFGLPEGTTPSIRFPKFDKNQQDKLKLLSQELDNELREIKHQVTIVLDEFPELIWKFGQLEEGDKQKESRKIQTQYLLEGLRALRQEEDKENRTKRIILAGSVNLPNTLEHLGLEHSINDLDRLKIPYLTPEQSLDLILKLIEGNDIKIIDRDDFSNCVKKQIGICSPFYIQIFAESMVQHIIDRGGNNSFSSDDVKLCYKRVLTSNKGPRYLKDRIKKYYLNQEDLVEHILTIAAKEQFVNKKYLSEEELNTELQKKGLDRSKTTDLLAKMTSDDLIQFLDDGTNLGFQSQILCNFWNYTYIDTDFWYDS